MDLCIIQDLVCFIIHQYPSVFFFEKQIDRIYGVLIESKADTEGYFTGYTANYIPVKVKLPNGLNGSLVDIKITGVSDEDYLIGEII